MISITCTQCRTVLTIDEAFAGGVCRCQHCGTIQTVPSQLKPSATPAPFVGPSSTTSKSLYQKQGTARTSGANVATTGTTSPSGLDDLAQAVVSSGLSGSGLRNNAQNTSAAQFPATPQAHMAPAANRQGNQDAPSKSKILPLAIGGGVLLLAIVGVILYFVFFHNKSDDSAGGPSTAAFCNTPITGSTVIYVLDRANSIGNDFDDLKAATYISIRSLGPDRKFAVILWNNGGADVAFPNEGFRNATSDQIEMLQKQLDPTQATGASVLRGALERAVARKPDSIVVVTAKTKLEDDDQAAVADLKTNAKAYTFVVGGAFDNNVLKLAAKTTGGQYRQITSAELRDATK